MAHDIRQWGFRSFKFRDPLFGQDRRQVSRLAGLIGRLPKRIQFSIETRIELTSPDMLRELKDAGLTSITFGVETPEIEVLRRHQRVSLPADRQREFVERCRSLGIRTVAGFMIGFPDDTEQSIRRVLAYAKWLNPTFANFNIVTPYPGTRYFRDHCERGPAPSFHDFTVYRAVLPCRQLSAEQVQSLHDKCFRQYYFRWQYVRENAELLWPGLRRWRAEQPPAPVRRAA
jgi:anaerobic magnesium-protoporphyrin IX monomethyl ester cyclase